MTMTVSLILNFFTKNQISIIILSGPILGEVAISSLSLKLDSQCSPILAIWYSSLVLIVKLHAYCN